MEETTAAFSRECEGAAVAFRKRARMKRRTRVAARKALAVFVSVVLVVGLMPGMTAWGEDVALEESDAPPRPFI